MNRPTDSRRGVLPVPLLERLIETAMHTARVERCAGERVANVLATGWAITESLAVTALHGIDVSSVCLRFRRVRSAAKGRVVEAEPVARLGPEGTLTLLRLRTPFDSPLSIRPDTRGSSVFRGAEVWMATANAARPVEILAGMVTAVEPAHLEHDLATLPGASGGPLFDADGKVVAVHYARGSDGTGLAHRIPALLDELHELHPDIYEEILAGQGILSPAAVKQQVRAAMQTADASDPMTDGLKAAAAVLWEFDPSTLAAHNVTAPDGAAWSHLWQDVDVRAHAGNVPRWALRTDARRTALRALAQPESLRAARRANGAMDSNPGTSQWIMDRLLEEQAPLPLETMTSAQLEDVGLISGWLRPYVPTVPDEEVVRQWESRARLVESLRDLAGEHFQGRRDELARLQAWLDLDGDGPHHRAAMRIHGLGGVGKSALVAHLLLENMKSEPPAFPLALLDFDRAVLSASDEVALLAEIARQVMAQRVSLGSAETALTAIVDDSLRARDDVQQDSDIVAVTSSTQALTARLVDAIADYAFVAGAYGLSDPPFVLVLDSYEEVQPGRGKPNEALVATLRKLQGAIARLRVLILARVLVDEPGLAGETEPPLALCDLDEDASTAYLASRGVPEDKRAVVLERARGNPLTLRLAADFIGQCPDELLADDAQLAQAMSAQLVQGVLYRRVLDHIEDEGVRALAHPGLVLRRVDSRAIEHILAGPCGLGEVDQTRAGQLWDGLRAVGSLVEVSGDVLVHRSDLRRAMVRLLEEDDPALVAAVDHAAVAWYASLPTPAPWERAELVFHLARTSQLERATSVWNDDLEGYFGAGDLDELADDARLWLARRVASQRHLVETTHGSDEERLRDGRRVLQAALGGTDLRALVSPVDELTELHASTGRRDDELDYLLGLANFRLGNYERVGEPAGASAGEPLDIQRALVYAEAREQLGDIASCYRVLGSVAHSMEQSMQLRGGLGAVVGAAATFAHQAICARFPLHGAEPPASLQTELRSAVSQAHKRSFGIADSRVSTTLLPLARYPGGLAEPGDSRALAQLILRLGVADWTAEDATAVAGELELEERVVAPWLDDARRFVRAKYAGDVVGDLTLVLAGLPGLDYDVREWLARSVASGPPFVVTAIVRLTLRALRDDIYTRLRSLFGGVEEAY